jgi:hypothetical protein
MTGLLHVDELASVLLDDRLDQRAERFRYVPIDWAALLFLVLLLLTTVFDRPGDA